MAALTTVKPENYGVSANVLNNGIDDCSVRSAFKKGHGGLMKDSKLCKSK
jgi:hypothetical protein